MCYPSGRKHWRHYAVKRREFITLIGSAPVAWPNIVQAQQQASLPIIGFLNSGAPTTPGVDGFREGLREGGYLEGTNVAIEYRFAEGRYELLPALVSELTQRPLALLAATEGVHTPLAAKHASAGSR